MMFDTIIRAGLGHAGWPLVQGGLGMLILTRRSGEAVIIGDNVRIAVLDIRGNQVRLGVEAPREVTVHREEVYRRIAEEQGVVTEDEDEEES